MPKIDPDLAWTIAALLALIALMLTATWVALLPPWPTPCALCGDRLPVWRWFVRCPCCRPCTAQQDDAHRLGVQTAWVLGIIRAQDSGRRSAAFRRTVDRALFDAVAARTTQRAARRAQQADLDRLQQDLA